MLYGAAEFSRDTDPPRRTLHASSENLELLRVALRHLQARRIALPPFNQSFLQKGHTIHFRSYHPDAFRTRLDVMTVMRGVDAFEELWKRRTQFVLPEGGSVELLSLPDLVRSKKTQRDKDWPMIRRLIEANYVNAENPSDEQIEFWLMESRTPRMLVELAQRYREQAESLIPSRPLLANACTGEESSVENDLEEEQKLEREADRRYWKLLFQELEELRGLGYDSEEDV